MIIFYIIMLVNNALSAPLLPIYRTNLCRDIFVQIIVSSLFIVCYIKS